MKHVRRMLWGLAPLALLLGAYIGVYTAFWLVVDHWQVARWVVATAAVSVVSYIIGLDIEEIGLDIEENSGKETAASRAGSGSAEEGG